MVLSFRHRLALRYSVIIALILISFSCVLYIIIDTNLLGGIRQDLESIAVLVHHELEEYILRPDIDDPFSYTLKETEPQVKHLSTELSIIIADADMKQLAASYQSSMPIDSESFNDAVVGWNVSYRIIGAGKSSYMQLIVPIKEADNLYLIIVSRSLANLEKTLSELRMILELMVVVSLILTAYSGLFLARRALAPIDQISITARNITEKNLQNRLPVVPDEGELKRLTDILNDMLDRLEEVFKTQKRFLGDASHEIRSPLTIMKGNLEVMLRKPRGTDEYVDTLESNLEEIDRLTTIVNDLLVLARAGTPEDQVVFEPVYLNSLLLRLCKKYLNKSVEAKVGFKFFAPDDDIYIYGNVDKLVQLFSNLLDNAFRYTAENGDITITLSRDAGLCRVAVEDSGIGISSNELSKIFERFYRTDKARTRVNGGAGLGLSICQHIAEQHKAEIRVESEQGRGSRFVVEFKVLNGRASLNTDGVL